MATIQTLEQDIKRIAQDIQKKRSEETALLRDREKYEREQHTLAQQISLKQVGVHKFREERQRQLEVAVAEKQRDVTTLKEKYEKTEKDLTAIRTHLTTLEKEIRQLEEDTKKQEAEKKRIKRIQEDEQIRENRKRELEAKPEDLKKAA